MGGAELAQFRLVTNAPFVNVQHSLGGTFGNKIDKLHKSYGARLCTDVAKMKALVFWIDDLSSLFEAELKQKK